MLWLVWRVGEMWTTGGEENGKNVPWILKECEGVNEGVTQGMTDCNGGPERAFGPSDSVLRNTAKG